MGLPLLIDVIRLTKPSAIVQFSSETDTNKNFAPLNDDYIATQPGWAYSGDDEDSEDTISYQEQEDCNRYC